MALFICFLLLFIDTSKATVPLLIKEDGQILDESLDIIYWAINSMPTAKKLNLLNIDNKQKIESLIFQNDNQFKFHLDRYKYFNRYSNIEKEEHAEKSKFILMQWNKIIRASETCTNNGWLVDGSESVADWCLWPFVRQYRLIDADKFDNDNDLENIKRWLNFYLKHKLFSALMHKYKIWQNSYEETTFPN